MISASVAEWQCPFDEVVLWQCPMQSQRSHAPQERQYPRLLGGGAQLGVAKNAIGSAMGAAMAHRERVMTAKETKLLEADVCLREKVLRSDERVEARPHRHSTCDARRVSFVDVPTEHHHGEVHDLAAPQCRSEPGCARSEVAQTAFDELLRRLDSEATLDSSAHAPPDRGLGNLRTAWLATCKPCRAASEILCGDTAGSPPDHGNDFRAKWLATCMPLHAATA